MLDPKGIGDIISSSTSHGLSGIDPYLGIRGGNWTRGNHRFPFNTGGCQTYGQFFQSINLENGLDFYAIPRPFQFCNQFNGFQAVAAQVEKIIRSSRFFCMQDRPHRIDQYDFPLVLWCNIFYRSRYIVQIHLGQSFTVYFAAAGEGHGFQMGKAVGQHIFRQFLSNSGTESPAVRFLPCVKSADELTACLVFSHNHRCPRYCI